MYTDHILFLIGALGAVLFIFSAGYLLISMKRSRLFKEILRKETNALETITEAMQSEFTGAARQSDAKSARDGTEGTILTATDDTIATGSSGYFFTSDNSQSNTQIPGVTNIQPVLDFDPDILKGQYAILGEIPGGGMSRVFLARKENVGNDWIVKYVPASVGNLTNEGEILKSLNHISLPKIIDVFQDESGLYLVESYVEGVGMNRMLRKSENIHEFVVIDWAQQLAQVLAYLHRNGPVLHLDLKPSNIMVTHDNKLVLIDFGISRRQNEDERNFGVTVSYAAPEQLKKIPRRRGKEIIDKRFGDQFPEERLEWRVDERTDIYSFGMIMFEAAVGHIPTYDTMNRIDAFVSPGFAKIIKKCLALNPDERYASVEDLLADITNERTHSKPVMIKTLFMRRAAAFASVFSVALAVFGFAAGFFVMQREVMAAMHVNPGVITVSLLQSAEIRIGRLLPGSDEAVYLDPAQLSWDFTADHVAQIDGNRIIGINTGQTMFTGTYRAATITVSVNVVEPMDGMVDISQRFMTGRSVSLFAGTEYRDFVDGADMEFVSPQSMDISASGAIYFADSGVLRRIYNGIAESIEINPPFLRPHIVRLYGEDVYILTSSWQDDGGFFFGIIRISPEGGGEGFFLADAGFTVIRDMYVANGLIYFIERNYGTERTHLRTINVNDADDVRTLIEVPEGTAALTVYNGSVFMSDGSLGTVFVYADGGITHVAGAAGERAFIDGTAPLFYRPTRLRMNGGALYVWDFNVLRRLEMANGVHVETMSVAGLASPVYDMRFAESEPAERIVLPFSLLTDFLPHNGGMLITDPVRGVIWQVE